MEDGERLETRQVQVLRHRFEMSTRLSQKTIEILKLQSGAFQVFGTKRVAIDGIDYHRYKHDLQINGIRKNFRRRDAPIYLSGSVLSRESTHGRVELAFQVQEEQQEQFDNLLTGLDVLPDLLPEKILEGHYIIVDVASNALLQSRSATIDAVSELASEITDSSNSRLYYFKPLDISGFDARMRLPLRNIPNISLDAS